MRRKVFVAAVALVLCAFLAYAAAEGASSGLGKMNNAMSFANSLSSMAGADAGGEFSDLTSTLSSVMGAASGDPYAILGFISQQACKPKEGVKPGEDSSCEEIQKMTQFLSLYRQLKSGGSGLGTSGASSLTNVANAASYMGGIA